MRFWGYPDQIMQNSVAVLQNDCFWVQKVFELCEKSDFRLVQTCPDASNTVSDERWTHQNGVGCALDASSKVVDARLTCPARCWTRVGRVQNSVGRALDASNTVLAARWTRVGRLQHAV